MNRLEIAGTDVSVTVREGETMLRALNRVGYSYRVGCRRGGCGTCVVDVVEGRIAYDRPVADSVLSREDRADGACLSCCAVPQSDVVITVRPGTNLRHIVPLLSGFGTKVSRRE